MAFESAMTSLQQLLEFLSGHPRVALLTGAGISVSSGIPTYRDKDGRWQRSDPIQHQQFVSQTHYRQRYWGRSFAGWPAVQRARPNEAHRAIARLEDLGFVDTVITQNVDRLHQRAGSRSVVDLHGRLDRVICLQCESSLDREAFQHRLASVNPFLAEGGSATRPDGDADIDDALVARVSVPNCQHCDGVLMPDVVFFGGSVPRDRVQRGLQAVENSDALLVVGSSLTVYSGFRFCRHADKVGKPVVIINPGITRADDLAYLKLEEPCGPLLAAALEAILSDSHVAANI